MKTILADKDYQITVTEEELENLMQTTALHDPLDIVFGPNWVALNWHKGQPMPLAVKQLGIMRGVLNENMNGAGI